MNLGSVWGKLNTQDKIAICMVISSYGINYTHSYLHQHRFITYTSNRLIFLKLKPIYYALKSYKHLHMNTNHVILVIEEYFKEIGYKLP
jgi:hypothetical protein